MVVGTAATGAPIIVQRDDRALSTSFRTQSKMALLTTLTDESINTLAEADKKAWQTLDSVARGLWEGTILVAGVFPDLFDLNTGSATYGAGGSVHLHYSPLGINGVDFHVKGIVLHENTTEVQLSNPDLLLLNAITDARGRAEKSESFLAPTDPLTTAFVHGYYGAVVNYDLFMTLCTAASTPIPELVKVPTTKFINSRYNAIIYHGEFEMGNGHTLDGSPVTRIELREADGTLRAYYDLPTSEQFPKWTTTQVVAEVACKAT